MAIQQINTKQISVAADVKSALDAANKAALATAVGVGTGDSPQFTAINVGHASDTTLSKASAGDLQIEANIIYRAAGTDVPVTDGGTGSSSASGARTNLGLVIGTNVQAYDAQLDSLAAFSGAQVTRGIADDNLMTVDSASAANDDYAKFTADGLEGRSYSEVVSDLSLVIGTNTQAYDAQLDSLAAFSGAQVTRGIVDDNLMTVDSSTAASGEYAKFTANGLESKSLTEMMADLSGSAGADFAMNTRRITGVLNPTNAQDAATKIYVDSVAQGLDSKDSVALSTIAALATVTYANGSAGVGATLTADSNGILTIDGVTVNDAGLGAGVNARILVKNQVEPAHNGIYYASVLGTGGAAFVLTRALDFDQNDEMVGAFVFVEKGGTLADTGFVMNEDAVGTIGTTDGTADINFTQFSSAGLVSGGDGILKTGNVLSVDLATNPALQITSNKLDMKIKTNSGLAKDAGGVTLVLDGSTLSMGGSGVKVGDLAIANGQIDNSAAIALSKLASINAGQVLVGPNGNGAPAAVNMGGDVTIAHDGVTTIGATKVQHGMLNSNAVAANGGLQNATGLKLNIVVKNLKGSDALVDQAIDKTSGTFNTLVLDNNAGRLQFATDGAVLFHQVYINGLLQKGTGGTSNVDAAIGEALSDGTNDYYWDFDDDKIYFKQSDMDYASGGIDDDITVYFAK